MNNANEQAFKTKWKSIVNVLKSQNLNISRVAQAGSRAKRQHRPDSDMDVILAVAGNPGKSTFYPILIERLKSNYPNESIYAGSNNNVVHIDFQNGGKFDLVLLSEEDFDSQYQNIKVFRKENL